MQIKNLKIEISPQGFTNYGHMFINMRVKTSDGLDFGVNEVIAPNDFISHFDLIFDKAKEQIKHAMREGNHNDK